MAKCVTTMHSKVRYSERVGYRESMEKTLKKVVKYGVRIDDVPKKHHKERCFLQKNKIYYKGKVYIFANQNEYHRLVTVYSYKNTVLEEIFQFKESLRKERLYKQMFTTQQGVLYKVSLYKGRIYEIKAVKDKKYNLTPLEDKNLRKMIYKNIMKLLKGKEGGCKITPYLEFINEEEKEIYKRVMEIKPGETITFKQLAAEFNITVQKLSAILKRCPTPILIPTHRIIKTNGQIGSHILSKDLIKKLLNHEKIEANKPVKERREKKLTLIESNNEFLSYNLGSLLQCYYA